MNASEKPSSEDLDKTVLWDVVEEHLERLDSSITAFLRAHTHPLTTFPEVARGIDPGCSPSSMAFWSPGRRSFASFQGEWPIR